MTLALFDRNQRIKNRLDRQFNRIIKHDLKFGTNRFKLQTIENDIRKLEEEENKEKQKLYSRIANILIVIAAAFFDIVLCQDSAPKLTERVTWFPSSQITIPIIIVIIEMCLANFVLQSIHQEDNQNNEKNWENWFKDMKKTEKAIYILNIVLTGIFIIGLPLLSYTILLDERAVPGLNENSIRELSIRYLVMILFSLVSHIIIALNFKKILLSFRDLRMKITNYAMRNTIIKKRKKFNLIKKKSIELLRITLEKAVAFIREVQDIQNNNPIDQDTQKPRNPNLPSYILPIFPGELSYAVVNYFGYNIIPTTQFQLQPALYRDPILIFESLLSNNERKTAIQSDNQRKNQENQQVLNGKENDHDRIRREWDIIERERREQIEREERERRQQESMNQHSFGVNGDGNNHQGSEEGFQEEDARPHIEKDFDGLF